MADLTASNATNLRSLRLTDGILQMTTNGGTSWMPVNPPPMDWWSQRELHANGVLNAIGIQVDQPMKFDYATVTPQATGTAAPTVVTTKSGVAYSVVNGQLTDMPGAVSNTVIANPQAEAWYMARKCAYTNATVTGSQSGAVFAASLTANNYIIVTINAGLSTTHHQLVMDNGSGSPSVLDLATLNTGTILGGSLAPVGAPFTIAMWFDLNAGTLNVAFQDVLVASVSASSGGLAKMPILGLPLATFCGNGGPITCYGGFAMIKGPST
jgi:hypothetical protein